MAHWGDLVAHWLEMWWLMVAMRWLIGLEMWWLIGWKCVGSLKRCGGSLGWHQISGAACRGPGYESDNVHNDALQDHCEIMLKILGQRGKPTSEWETNLTKWLAKLIE